MGKQKPLTKQQEIMYKHWVNPFQTMPEDWYNAIGKMMDDWGLELFKHLEQNNVDFSCEAPTKTSAKEFYNQVKTDLCQK